MATQGTLIKNVSSGYRLQLEWSATPDKVNNRSTIETKLYWMSLGSSYTISSGTKSGRSEIGGVGEDFEATASLSGNQKKLLKTYSRTVSHNSEGNLTINLKGVFNANVTLSNVYYGTQTVSGNVTLDPIPRESSITSSFNFTAPNGFPISISRSSSSYTHTVRLYVDGTLIKTSTGVGTGITWGFTESEMTAIFNKLNKRSSCPLQLQLDTYSGSSKVGNTKSYSGTVFAEDPSTNVNSPSFDIGDSVTVAIARNNSNFTHVVKFSVGGTVIHTSPVVGFGYTWNPTSDEIKAALLKAKTTNSATSGIEITTYYNGVQVDQPVLQSGTATVKDANPVFTANFTYEDSNSTTVALTGDKLSIVQNKSTIKVVIPVASRAQPQKEADMVKYTASLGGQTISQNWSGTADVVFNFSAVSAATNLTLSITAIDSRNNQTKATKTVTVVPYSVPSMNATAKRLNGFEALSKINLNGVISPLTVGGVQKNAVLSASYRYKENVATASYPTAWTPLTVSTNVLTYTAAEASETLDQTKQYIFQIKVTDKLGDTIVERTINKGLPIYFIDTVLLSIGIGMFPLRRGGLDVKGDISARNPNNINAEVYLGWKNDIARMRVGGTGAGSINGMEIQGTGDTPMIKLKNGQTLEVVDGSTVKINGIDLIRTLEVPWKALPTATGWSPYFGGGYSKSYDGLVIVQGMVQGTMNKDANGNQLDTIIANLPAGCRPIATNLVFFCHTRTGTPMRVDVNTNGDMVVKGGVESGTYSSYLDLAGIIFRVN